MTQFGWGLISSIIADQEDVVPAYRWDLEGSQYFELRPDRVLLGLAYLTNPRVRIHHDLQKIQEFTSSRGGGGPSAQGGKSGAPARASTRGSRHRRKSCPKGHYWSYKEKKCMKSKFR